MKYYRFFQALFDFLSLIMSIAITTIACVKAYDSLMYGTSDLKAFFYVVWALSSFFFMMLNYDRLFRKSLK